MKLKNPGSVLKSVFRGALDLIPREFRAKLGIEQTVQQQPTDVDADTPDGLSLVESRVEQERTNERKKTNVKLVGALTTTLVAEVKLPDGQVGVSTRRLVAEGTPLVVDATTTDGQQANLGNGLLDQTVIEAPEVLALPRFEVEIPDTVPEKFKVALPTTTTDETIIGVAEVPVLGPGDLVKSEEQLDVFKTRTKVRTRATVPVPQTLLGKDTNERKQVVSTTDIYRNEGLDTLPTATKDVAVENLGDGRVIETQKDIPEVFDPVRFEKHAPDIVPESFRVAIPTRTIEHVVPGIATEPPTPLPAGVLAKSEEQVTKFTKRTSTTDRGSVVLPITLTGKETNDAKQIVTRDQTYKVAGGDAVPSALQDVEVLNLGDGRVLQTIKSVPEVFDSADQTASILDTIPPEFQVIIPKRRIASVAAGTVLVPPVLVGTQLEKRVTRINEFEIRTEVVDRDAFQYPKTLDDRLFGGVHDGQGSVFTGAVVRERTLAITGQALDISFLEFDSKITNVGGAQTIKETDSLPAYPTLAESIEQDDEVVLKRTKTLVATGTIADVVPGHEIKQYALDSQRILRVDETLSFGTDSRVSRSVRIFDGEIDVELPTQLLSVTCIANQLSAADAYGTSTFAYGIIGKGSGGITVHGTAKGSSGVLPDLTFLTRQPWGRNVPCIHYMFMCQKDTLENFSVLANVNVLRLNRGDPACVPWPKFAPRDFVILCKGQHITGNVVVDAHASEVMTADYLGVLKLAGAIRNGGGGGGFDIELSNKVIRIPATIHPTLTITLPDLSVTTTAVATVFTGAAVSSSNSIIVTANGSLSGVVIPGTPGSQSIPLAGNCVYRSFVEPYKMDYVKIHAIVVDFANIL